jgi:Retrotransposon gag protein.
MLSRSSRTTSHRFGQSISDESRFAILSPPLSHALGSTHSRADLTDFHSSLTASLRSTLGSAFSHEPLLSHASSPMSRYDPQSYVPSTSTLPEDYAPLFYRSHHSSLTSGSLNGSQATTAELPPSLRSPDVFTGRNPARLIPFISQCILWFIAQPYGFLTQRDSVLFASSYLRGPAGSWWMNVLAEYPLSPLVDDWYLFTTQLFKLFGTRNLRQTAQRALLNMKMLETARVTEYIITFNSYVPYAGWNDSASVSQFYRGLANRLKDMFQYVPRPQTLVDMQDYVMEFDHRYWERRAEEEFTPTEYSTSPALSSPPLLPRSPSLLPRSPLFCLRHLRFCRRPLYFQPQHLRTHF